MTPSLLRRICAKGARGLLAAASRRGKRAYHLLRTRAAPIYRNPDAAELAAIESGLATLGIPVTELDLDPGEFEHFNEMLGFPADYHGGPNGPVYREKLLEHYVAWQLLGLGSGSVSRYVDIAAAASPWAKMLRQRGLDAYAIDLDVPAAAAGLDYYRREDATRMSFAAGSVDAASLQCAYEMFVGDDDIALLHELARVLKPGGRTVIAPLYMHVQPCHYQSPEYFGRPFGDAGSLPFVRRDTWGIPASRKYSPESLRSRVLATASAAGLQASLRVLRDQARFGDGIYLHFVLILDKPAQEPK